MNHIQKIGDQPTQEGDYTDPKTTPTRTRTPSVIIVRFALIVLALGGSLGFIEETTAKTVRAAGALVYTVDPNTAAGGVFARSDPHTNDTQRIVGYGVYPNQQVLLLCGVTDGDPVGQYQNKTWHFVTDISNPGEGNFWLSDHYVLSPNVANQLAPGESTCPNENSNPLQATGSLPCTPILVIGARGSGDAYQKGTNGLWGFNGPLSPLVHGLMQYYGSSNVTPYGLPYPADPVDIPQHLDNVIFSTGYQLSVQYGIEDLITTVTTQAQACPSQMIDLIGYSQGADVVNSTIPLLSQQVRDHINGVVTFGDPQFGGRNAEDRGSYNPADNGLEASVYGPRPELPADILTKSRSYCDGTDYVCNVSPKSLLAEGKGHGTYATTHVPEAEQFLESLPIVFTGSY